MRLIYLLPIVGLAWCMPPLPGRDCGPCDQQFCPTRTCEHGTVKDICGCCDICVRIDGEKCGGIMSFEGKCDQGYFCNGRHEMAFRNVLLPADRIGKCEPDACKGLKCPSHQWCTLKNNNATCYCHQTCTNEDAPICGLLNGKQYKNMCELRREECETQTPIKISPGPCQVCTDDDGKIYKQGQRLETENICEYRLCRDGAFATIVDTKCLAKNGFCSSKFLPCKPGEFCLLSKDKSKMGKCTKLNPGLCYFDNRVFKTGERFVDSGCTGQCKCEGFNKVACVSLCPPTMVQCTPGQFLVDVPKQSSEKPLCHCMVPSCLEREIVCSQKAESGSCYAYFERWYHDTKSGECKKFVYGGCAGNGNNFRTKVDCEKGCKPPKKVVSDLGTPERKVKEGSFIPGGTPRSKPDLSTTTLTIKGNVKFDKTMRLQKPSCLVITFYESSRQDSMAVIMETMTIGLSYHNTADDVPYELDTLKPVDKELEKTYTIRAAAYVGHCPIVPQIRKGDFMTTNSHAVSLTKDKNTYTKDIRLNCYHCKVVEKRDAPETSPVFFDAAPPSIIGSSPDEPDMRGGFPFGGARPTPPMSDEKIVLKGLIKLPHKVNGNLPANSCVKIKFKDVSVMDVSSITLAETTIEVSEVDIGSSVSYEFESKLPVNFAGFSYSLSVTINYGWCPTKNGREWVRRGDYLSDTHHGVVLEKGVYEYVTDVKVVCYVCPSDRGTLVESKTKEIDTKTEEIDTKTKEVTPDEPSAAVVIADSPQAGVEAGEEAVVGEGSEEGEVPGFPLPGFSSPPKLSDKTMTIKGFIKFPSIVGTLPSPSCLYLTFTENTLQDASDNVLSQQKIDVSESKIEDTLAYTISSQKPEENELWKDYAMRATLNKGWCSSKTSGGEWLRKGDYTVDTVWRVELDNETDVYDFDFSMIHYPLVISPFKPTDTSSTIPTRKTFSANAGEDLFVVEGEDSIDELLEEPVFPFGGTAPAPKLSDNNMTIKGYINFQDNVGKLPKSSCLFIKFTEQTAQDVSENVISQIKLDVSESNIDKKFAYVIDSQKPVDDELWKTYAISAILNRGWCSEQKPESEWLRKGDFIVDTEFIVQLKKDKYIYDVDFDVIEYGKSWTTKTKEVTDTNKGPKLGNTFMEVYGVITFEKPLAQLALGSCLRYMFQDTTEQDVSAFLVKERKDDFSGKAGNNFKYFLGLRKPEDTDRTFEVTAILNVGWCPTIDDKEWIRVGDYQADTSNEVILKKDINKYEVDIEMTQLTPPTPQCIVNGKKYEHGERWSESDCKLCECLNGEKTCMVIDCAPCKNPSKQPGVCCPKCLDVEEVVVPEGAQDEPVIVIPRPAIPTPTPKRKGCYDEELKQLFAVGQSWNHGSCSPCSCQNDGEEPLCMIIDCVYTMVKPCKNLVYKEGVCCPDCADEGQCLNVKTNESYIEGERWMPTPCESCACEGGQIVCSVMDCAALDCDNTVTPYGQCCPVCAEQPTKKSCVDAVTKQSYAHGEKWKPEACESCECFDGKAACLAELCARPMCDNPIQRPGECCEVCPEKATCINKSTKKTYLHGEKWKTDACTFCYCENGIIACAASSCAKPKCKSPVTLPGECCAVCPTDLKKCSDATTNNSYTHGEKWKPDPCSFCQCDNGESRCASKDCGWVACGWPITRPGECCAVCSIADLSDKTCIDPMTTKTYKDGESWQSDSCTSCTCDNGVIACASESCGKQDCENPIWLPGKCCEICDDDIKTCYDKNLDKTIVNGNSWKKDSCTSCICQDGEEVCAVQDCAQPACLNPVRKPGQCCPVCLPVNKPQCFDRSSKVVRKDGEHWVENNGCDHCQCDRGQRYCSTPMCVLPECDEGVASVHVEGVCCPVCANKKTCKDETTYRVYIEGNTWQNDQCKLCKCTASGVKCEDANRDIVGCSSVVTVNRACGEICLDDPDTDKEIEP